MLAETQFAAPPSPAILVTQIEAAGLTAKLNDAGRVVLTPKEAVTDDLRELLRPHRDVLADFLRNAQMAEIGGSPSRARGESDASPHFLGAGDAPSSWSEVSAVPDAHRAHIEERGFAYVRLGALRGETIIIAKTDCAIPPVYLGHVVFYECELPAIVEMTHASLRRLHGHKAALLTLWQGFGWYAEAELLGMPRRVGGFAKRAGMGQDEAYDLLDYLGVAGVASSWTSGGGCHWRLLPPVRRGHGAKGATE